MMRRSVPILSTTVLGALCAVGGALCFVASDTAVKSLSGDYALHQVIVMRSVVSLTLLAGLIIPLSGGFGQLRTRAPMIHLGRGVLILTANMSFFLALAAMPIADATAIFFVAPLLMALMSIVFLGEKVGPWRWGAIAVGLVGVIVMIRPGSDAFALVALLPLLGAVGYAGNNTLTRHLGLRESAISLAFYIQLTFLVFSLCFGLVLGDGRLDTGTDASLSFLLRAWVWPDTGDLGVILVAGIGSGLGGVLISQAYRTCEAALVAPLEYLALPFSILMGLLVFGDWPVFHAWIGIFLIVGSGLLLIYRESRN